MKRRAYILTTVVVFATVATLHALRVVLAWDLILGNVFIPYWVSWLAVALTAFLAYSGIRLNRLGKRKR